MGMHYQSVHRLLSKVCAVVNKPIKVSVAVKTNGVGFGKACGKEKILNN